MKKPHWIQKCFTQEIILYLEGDIHIYLTYLTNKEAFIKTQEIWMAETSKY